MSKPAELPDYIYEALNTYRVREVLRWLDGKLNYPICGHCDCEDTGEVSMPEVDWVYLMEVLERVEEVTRVEKHYV